MTTELLPTYYLSHGGGPWPWIKDMMGHTFDRLEESLRAMPGELPFAPTAILCISGHWEERSFTVSTHPNPPMLYDYGGFPEHTYRISYPAPGSPALAARVAELLGEAGIPTVTDAHRGFDHGTFVPLYVAWPEADVPIVQLSMRADYDPAAHLALGRALAPLRAEGVLIIGSGYSFHNLRLFGPAAAAPSKAFDGWLDETVRRSTPEQRVERLLAWDRAPAARQCHPREDHLIPLMVAVGAAEHDEAVRVYHEDGVFGGVTASGYRFG